MERADKIEVPEGKLKEMKYRAQGEQLAASFLKNSSFALADELAKFDVETKKYVSMAVETILLQNLSLPKKESDASRNEQVFLGLEAIKKDKNGLKQAKDQLDNLSNYYAQAVKQSFDQLKANVERAMNQAVQQKTGKRPGSKMNVEQMPEFQENWRQVSVKLDAEYGKALNQLKQQISTMS